jgi:predicted Zn finger-like uncharacterized protein
MILTCPACDTKYVVKDDAIPPGGRQVRCASCKHSWHQDPDEMPAEPATAADIDLGGPPPPQPDMEEQPLAEAPAEAEAIANIASEPQPGQDEESPWGAISSEPVASDMPLAMESSPEEVAMEEAPAVADDWRGAPAADGLEVSVEAPAQEEEEEFVGYAPIADEHEGSQRRWPLILVIVLLIALGAAAFWFFAPQEWRARAGIAEAGATPLQLMITTSDRQPLQSGNELVAISGRVINPTDREQNVPPIRAELRDKQTKQLVHSWTIEPPARVLAPRSSASFNSAEVDVPKGGDELTVSLGKF